MSGVQILKKVGVVCLEMGEDGGRRTMWLLSKWGEGVG